MTRPWRSVAPYLYVPVAIGTVVRAIHWAVVTPRWVPDSDAEQYILLARSLARGDGFAMAYPQIEVHATAFRPPLYPVLLSVPSSLFDDVLWPLRLTSLMLGLVVIALGAHYTRRIAGPTAGLVAGCCIALYPPLIVNDTVTLTEPLALALMLGLLLALLDRRPVLSGALTGLLLLTRPNAYLVVVIVVIVLWRAIGWRRAGVGLATVVVVVVPWLIRNQMQLDTFRLTTSDGLTLAATYAPLAQERGTYVDPLFDPAYDGSDVKALQFDEPRWSARLTELAIDGVRDHPAYVLDVVGRNLLGYFELRPGPNDDPETLDGRNLDFRHATLPFFYLVTVVGFAGIVVRARDRRIWPLIAIVGQFALLSLLLVAPPRLRAPVDLMACIGVGFLWAHLRADLRAPKDAAAPIPS